MEALIVYITAPDRETATGLAGVLVRERLCACANILDGMESLYWWEGKLESGREAVLICKTTREGYPALERRVREQHPYDTPCIVAWPATHGYAPFLQWISNETRS